MADNYKTMEDKNRRNMSSLNKRSYTKLFPILQTCVHSLIFKVSLLHDFHLQNMLSFVIQRVHGTIITLSIMCEFNCANIMCQRLSEDNIG